jgi:collagen type VI alpha
MGRGDGKIYKLIACAAGAIGLVCAASAASATTLDVMFVVDGSGSIGSSGFAQEQAFVENAITNVLPSDGNAGAILFSSGVDQNQSLIALGSGGAATLSNDVAGWTYPTGGGYQKVAFNAAITDFVDNSPAGDQRLLVEVTDDGAPYPVTLQSACGLASTLQADNITVAFVNGNAPSGPSSTESCLATSADIFTAGTFADLTNLTPDLQTLVNQLDAPATIPGPPSLSIFAAALAGLISLRALRRRHRRYTF